MKFRALALDYDGTIAEDGVLNPDVRAAIAEVRACGTVVVIVTGRTISDLKRVVGNLDFIDAVVAENGAVLELPNRYSMLIGAPPPAVFFEELTRRGIKVQAGQCVVESDGAFAPQFLEVIRQLELPLVLLFNRSRLMILPQGVSKSVGLHRALSALHLSSHNAIAIGDAENDHDLLASCELGVAVGWGSSALKHAADEVLEGEGPDAVAEFIRKTCHEMRLAPSRIGRYRVPLGTSEDGRAVALSIRGRNALVSGDPRSGKSWVTGLACEKMILQGYCVCVIDPEGDYRTLESLPGVILLGGDDPPPQLPDLARILRHPEMSVVIDLSHVPYKEKIDYLHSLLPMLAAIRRSTGLPHRIVVDEAHYFLHDRNAKQMLDLSLNAYTLVTYRISDLNNELRKTIEANVVTRTTDPREVRALAAMAENESAAAEWASVLGGLSVNQAVLLPGTEEAEGKLIRFDLLPRLTAHVRHKAKYLDVRLMDRQAFVFTQNDTPWGPPARTLEEFIELLKSAPAAVLEGHAHRADFSRWIAEVFHDRTLAATIRKTEQRYRLGHVQDLTNSLAAAVRERYEFSSTIPSEAEPNVVW
ncbi:MAG TPA: HAD hydrolase family protein [Verrucomicrobiae bacterium]|nr:HAD hydrolase family protein [Verrucomicrobiae bacterium]